MFLKRMFYASASVLMLALAYHLGAQTASAQTPGNPVVAAFQTTGGYLYAFTANGDVYYNGQGPWTRIGGNVFGGGPVPTQQETWGATKARYRVERGAQPQNR